MLGGAALGAATWVAPSVLSIKAAAASSACADCGPNLVPNPSGENFVGDINFDGGAGVPPLPDSWNTSTGMQVTAYGHTQFPVAGALSPIPPTSAGAVMFCGAMDNGAGANQLLTSIDVPIAACAAVGTGTVGFTLSGYLGGSGTIDDTMAFRVEFYNGPTLLSSTSIGPVTPADRSNLTQLVQRTTTGTVPSTTTSVRFVLAATRSDFVNARTTACADLLSFVLNC